MQHLETCVLIAEADRVLCHLVMVKKKKKVKGLFIMERALSLSN